MSPLVTLTGDGTFRAPSPQQMITHELPDDPHLAALTRLRSLLGDDLEDQIATRMFLPAALGIDDTDHLLPSTLVLLAETTGDLASYGWRMGPGRGRAWQHAREQRERLIDAARIALYGYEGPVMVTALGPASLAASTFLSSGERTLSDPGAVRDLPMLLAEGLTEQLDLIRDRVPGAQPQLLLREDAVAAVVAGRIPTPSGRRRYPPIPAPEVGTLWRCLVAALGETGSLGAEDITLGVGADAALITAAREAGARRLAVAPRRQPALPTEAGRAIWEGLAAATEDGCALELVVDPRPGGGMTRELEQVLETWRKLGYSASEAAGFGLIAHPGGSHEVHEGRLDPSEQPGVSSLLDESALEALLRAAPGWAERVQR